MRTTTEYQTPCGNPQHQAYRILWAVYPPAQTAKDPAGLRSCCAVDTADWVRRTTQWCSPASTVLSACVALHRPCRDPYFRPPPANTATWNRPCSHPSEPTNGRCRSASTIMSLGRHAADWPHCLPSEVPRPHPAAHGCLQRKGKKRVWVDIAKLQRSGRAG